MNRELEPQAYTAIANIRTPLKKFDNYSTFAFLNLIPCLLVSLHRYKFFKSFFKFLNTNLSLKFQVECLTVLEHTSDKLSSLKRSPPSFDNFLVGVECKRSEVICRIKGCSSSSSSKSNSLANTNIIIQSLRSPTRSRWEQSNYFKLSEAKVNEDAFC